MLFHEHASFIKDFVPLLGEDIKDLRAMTVPLYILAPTYAAWICVTW